MMVNLEITYSGVIQFVPEPQDGFDRDREVESVFEATMRELVKLGVSDPSVSGSIASGEIEISCLVTAPSLLDAINEVDPCVRSALHAATVATPTWEQDRLRVELTHFAADDAAEDDEECCTQGRNTLLPA